MTQLDSARSDRTRAAAPSHDPRGRRWSLRIGIVLLLAGVLILGYVGWEIYGTNVVSHRRQHQIVSQLEHRWSEPGGGGQVQTSHGTAGAIIRIPRFGSSYAVPVIQGVDEDELASGIGHFPGTAGAGRIGNFALAGHRITHGQPFSQMPELRPGDRVIVETRNHTYTYVLDTGGDSLRIPFTDTWVIAPKPVDPDGGIGPTTSSRRLITLTTCAELFHTDDRFVSFGHLVSVAGPTRA